MLDVAPTSPPGTTYVYSDLNLITLGVLLERQTGEQPGPARGRSGSPGRWG